ncbi:MAG TPA: zinc-binding alcohol dehydrogenase family protein [Tepidimicrobium sp.]|nr:zinc-binding alcohol dehydrogenase family protein [Tepidimicrobium sp.]
MKAIKVTKPFNIEICEVERPEIKSPDDVIIKVTSGGICGSDIGIFNGTNSLAIYPRIIGHEFGGIVEEVGENATEIKVGDKVAVDPVVSCGQCYACRIGRHNVCSSLEAMGVHRDGGFREYVSVNKRNVHKFNEDFDSSLLALVEPYTIGMQINSRGQISKGDKVLIVGSGAIGLCTLDVAKRKGAEVLIADIVPEKLEVAKKMGANRTVLVSEENLEKAVDEFTNKEGMPVIVDTVCSQSSFEDSVKMASPAGRIVVIGLIDTPSQIAQADITKKELTIVGSRLNCNKFDEVVEAFESKELKPELLKTHSFDFTQVKDALKLIENEPEKVIKMVLNFD